MWPVVKVPFCVLEGDVVRVVRTDAVTVNDTKAVEEINEDDVANGLTDGDREMEGLPLGDELVDVVTFDVTDLELRAESDGLPETDMVLEFVDESVCVTLTVPVFDVVDEADRVLVPIDVAEEVPDTEEQTDDDDVTVFVGEPDDVAHCDAEMLPLPDTEGDVVDDKERRTLGDDEADVHCVSVNVDWVDLDLVGEPEEVPDGVLGVVDDAEIEPVTDIDVLLDGVFVAAEDADTTIVALLVSELVGETDEEGDCLIEREGELVADGDTVIRGDTDEEGVIDDDALLDIDLVLLDVAVCECADVGDGVDVV